MVIEKYKSPVGDGNFIGKSYFQITANSGIEKYKSPVGDGNSISYT